MSAIVVRRSKLYPVAGFYSRGPQWRWTYDYAVDGGAWCQYGAGLPALRSMFKEKFPNATVEVTW